MATDGTTRTGSALLTFEQAADIGIFDGRIVAATTTTTKGRQAQRPPEDTPPKKPAGGKFYALVAAAGLLLLGVGLGVIFYAGFIQYGTDAIAASHQSSLASEFEHLKAQPPTTPGTTPVTVAATVDTAEFEDADDIPVLIGLSDEPPPPPPSSSVSSWAYETPPPQGEPVGRIVIPKIDVDWIVVQGVSASDLRKGPGHMPGTAMPGQLGNAVISGHRTTYGAPFNRVDLLEAGDQLTVETLTGIHTYEIVDLRITQPADIWVTSQWSGSWLTLTTCNPKGSSRERLIVFAKLIDGPNHDAITALVHPVYEAPQRPDDPTVRTSDF